MENKINKISHSFSFSNNIKAKEDKILKYYKRINNIEQKKIFAIPKRKKITKKNSDVKKGNGTDKTDTDNGNDKLDTDNGKLDIDNGKLDTNAKIEKQKLTKKNIVIMDD
jgi:hypothetical protein